MQFTGCTGYTLHWLWCNQRNQHNQRSVSTHMDTDSAHAVFFNQSLTHTSSLACSFVTHAFVIDKSILNRLLITLVKFIGPMLTSRIWCVMVCHSNSGYVGTSKRSVPMSLLCKICWIVSMKKRFGIRHQPADRGGDACLACRLPWVC